ncbi:MAG TPA: hypothetical protein VE152_02835, partial [Acidimicrobiales bacterium]|nr:hypothetical protein [Acidimicrobiales bacterium]
MSTTHADAEAAGVPGAFPALLAVRRGDQVERQVTELGPGDLPEGEVVVQVAWSSVNYKDA